MASAKKRRVVCDVWTNGGVRDLQRTTKERYSGGARPSSPSAARPNRRARSHRTPCPILGCTARKLLARFGPAIMARHRRLPQIVVWLETLQTAVDSLSKALVFVSLYSCIENLLDIRE